MQVEFNPGSGRLTFRHLELPHASIQGMAVWVSYHRQEEAKLRKSVLTGKDSTMHEESLADVHGTGRQLTIHCPPGSDGIELIYRIKTYQVRPFLLIQLSVRNLNTKPIYLHEGCVLEAKPSEGGQIELAEVGEGVRFFKVGWHGWDYTGVRTADERDKASWIDRLTSKSYTNPATARRRESGEYSSEAWGILAGEKACLVAGFASTAHQFGNVFACLQPGETACSMIIQLDSVRLDPGETRDSEWGYLQFLALPNLEPAADFMDAVAREMGARVPASAPPPMWTHWYQFYHEISEQRFLHNLDVLAEHQSDVPFQVVELDDGYQSTWGEWTVTNGKFPHGLEWLAKEICAKGFKPGLWLAPFAVQSRSRVARDHPDWLVKNKNGKPANAAFLYNMFIQALDLTNPDVLEYLKTLVHQLAQEWGYGMLKIDFLNASALPGKRIDPKLTRAEALRQGLLAIREGAGNETFLLGCGCPFGPAIGVVDAMRIGPDTAPSWEPWFNWMKWATPLVKSNPSMPSLRNALRNTINLSSLHKRWWWNDPDCLLVRDGDSRLTEAEVQNAVSLVGLSGGMLVSSDDLQNVSPEHLSWVSQLVPNLSLRGLPADLFEQDMPLIYRVGMERAGEKWQLVALFNWDDRPADLTLAFEKLGYQPKSLLHVHDFWLQKYQQVNTPEIVFRGVPPHGCKLLRICEVGEAPQIVGDTLHISQGGELASMRIADGKMIVETMDLGRLVEGELWLRLARTPQGVKCNSEQVMAGDEGEGVYSVKLNFTGKANIEIQL